MSTYDEHQNGDCWAPTCPICEMEGDTVVESVYGRCTGCGAIEARLNKATGTIDLSAIGEHHAYPTGYGCEFCA